MAEAEEDKPARRKAQPAKTPKRRVVRFEQAFYDNTYGLFNAGEVYEVPPEVVLPTRDLVYIEGAPPKAATDEIREGETVQRKSAEPAPDPRKGSSRKK